MINFDAIFSVNYLAVRSMVRQATLAKTNDMAALARARKLIEELTAQPANKDLAADFAKLANFIDARIAPEKHLIDLAYSLQRRITASVAGEFTKTLDLLVESEGSPDNLESVPANVLQNDLIDWIITFQKDDGKSASHAMAKWKQTHSVAWLLAAIAKADGKTSQAQDLIVAARNLPRQSPAYWSSLYHANRLDMAANGKARAKAALDALFKSAPAAVPLGTLNALKTQRLLLAVNLSEFIKFGIQVPVCLCLSGGPDEIPDDQKIIDGQAEKGQPLFTKEAGFLMDRKMPLSTLTRLAQDTSIPVNLRGRLAWHAWVRAVLVGDTHAARALALLMKPYNKDRSASIEAYLKADPESSKFAAALVMMQFSSADPNIGWGPLHEDSYGDASGWWWSQGAPNDYEGGEDSGTGVKEFNPQFILPAEAAQARAQKAALAKIATAPNYFAGIVLPWAISHPADPRTPQALHLLVKSTRYGATNDATTGYSKRAFQILHQQYKNSPWTKRTPYWY